MNRALKQIKDKAYKTQLLAKGIKQDMNKKLCFLHLFKGKEVVITSDCDTTN